MNTKLILTTVAAFIGGFALVKSNSKGGFPETQPEQKPESSPNPNNTNSNVATTDAFPLKVGSKGNNVSKLQRAINDYYLLLKKNKKIGVDGSFGPQTEAACLEVFGLRTVTSNLLNWLITTNEAMRFTQGITTGSDYTGRKVVLKSDLELVLYPASVNKPVSSSIKLSNGLYVVNSGLKKRFPRNTPFVVSYNGSTSVIADFGTIIKPDTLLNNSVFNNTVSSRYFMILKKDLTLV